MFKGKSALRKNTKELRLKISNEAENETSIEKLSVVVFPDFPTNGRCTVFMEGLLNSSTHRFHISCRSDKLEDVRGQFEEKEPCARIIDNYKILEDGVYSQAIDGVDRQFKVYPPDINVHKDGDPRTFFVQIDGEGSLGFWFKFETGLDRFSAGKELRDIVIECEGLDVKRLHPFVALPGGYGLSRNPAESSFQAKNSGPALAAGKKPASGTLGSFPVGDDWPLFMAWKESFLNKSAVVAKENISLSNGDRLTISMTTFSEKRVLRFQLGSFFLALFSALFLGVVVNYWGDYLYDSLEYSCVSWDDIAAYASTLPELLPAGTDSSAAPVESALLVETTPLSPNCPSSGMLRFGGVAALFALVFGLLSLRFSNKAASSV